MPGRGTSFHLQYSFSVIPHQSALRYVRPCRPLLRPAGLQQRRWRSWRKSEWRRHHHVHDFHAYFILHFTLILFSLSTQITLHFQYFACLFYFSEFFKIFRFSLAQLFLCVYNCLQKAKGSSRAKRAESRMHLLDPEPDLGNANVGRYDMHIFCRYTSTYICFFNLYEHIINRFFQ